jgi:lipopolysaccharide transport system permease protein
MPPPSPLDDTLARVSGDSNALAERAPASLRPRARVRDGVRGLRRAFDLLWALTESDLRFRYGRGPLRLARWLLEPFALVGVYLLLVTFVLDRPGTAPGLSLAATIVPFQLVMSTVGNAMESLETRRPILLNMAFERNLMPVSSALTECASFVASFSIVVVMMASYRIAPTLMLLWLPLVIVVNVYLAVAAAYAAALLGLWLRELKPFLLSFVRMLFFLGPGLVPLSQTSSHVRNLLRLNPLTGLFESYRDVFLTGQAPAAWQLVYPCAIATVILAAFVPLYRAEQRQFAKVV